MKTSRIVFLLVKVAVIFFSSVAMLFAISFNMLSEDALKKSVEKNFSGFFLTKFFIGLSVGLLFYLISLLSTSILNKRCNFHKKTIKRFALFELAYLIIFAAVATLIFVHEIL